MKYVYTLYILKVATAIPQSNAVILKNNIPFLSSPLITRTYTIVLHSDLHRVGLPKRLQTGRHCGIGGWCAVTCISMLCQFPQHQIHLLDRDKRFKQSTKENRNRESRFTVYIIMESVSLFLRVTFSENVVPCFRHQPSPLVGHPAVLSQLVKLQSSECRSCEACIERPQGPNRYGHP